MLLLSEDEAVSVEEGEWNLELVRPLPTPVLCRLVLWRAGKEKESHQSLESVMHCTFLRSDLP